LALLALLALPVRATVGVAPIDAEPRVAAPILSGAPANAQARQWSRSLLARLEFEEAGMQLAGIASFGGQARCFVLTPGSVTPGIHAAGDRIDDFRIVEIRADAVTLERDDARFELTLDGGDQASVETAAAPDAGPVLGFDDAMDTHAEPDPLEGLTQEINELIFAGMKESSEEMKLGMSDLPVVTIKSAADPLKSRTSRFQTAEVVQDAWSGSTGLRRSGAPEFIWPMQGRLTSGFGYRRHPMGGGSRMHNGVDLAASYGTPVRAAADGVVTRVGYNGALGRYIYVRHANGYETRYGHLSSRDAKVGQKVVAGEAIGLEGSTGNSTGPHLHFEIRKDGRAINPMVHLHR
jgi:hypothetical protein